MECAQVRLIQSWEALSTMTPFDHARLCNAFGKISGFQSFQYRMLEFCLSSKNAEMAEVFSGEAKTAAIVQSALENPSIYDETLKLLAHCGFAVTAERSERDFSALYTPCSRHRCLAADLR